METEEVDVEERAGTEEDDDDDDESEDVVRTEEEGTDEVEIEDDSEEEEDAVREEELEATEDKLTSEPHLPYKGLQPVPQWPAELPHQPYWEQHSPSAKPIQW
jgi:hypothetical protein